MRATLSLSLWTLFFIFGHFQSAFAQRQETTLSCKYLSPIVKSYLNRHVNFSDETGNLEARTIDQFIKRMDSSKLYLLKTDLEKIRSTMKDIFKKTSRPTPDCSAILAANTIFVQRVNQRTEFAKKYLGKDFKFDRETSLILDPDGRDYPASEKEATAFQQKYIQFQISSYIATDMQLQEAKEHVVRSYERTARRVAETPEVEVWSNYIDSFARALDPHSSYLSQDQLEDFQIQMRLELEGIGATLSSKDGFTVIEQLVPGGAAFRSGKLKTKDKIIAVAQDKAKFQNVIEMDLREVVRLIRGPKGSTVRLTILRKDGKETKRFEVPLVRDQIKLEDEAVSITYIDKEVEGQKLKIGLINLPSFYADISPRGRSAARDLKKVLKEAQQNNVAGIVLDLSTNGGGSLDDAVKIAGLFFKTGNVVKQSSRDPARGELELADRDPTVDYMGPMVVLISRISASASEIVAGTLQDYKRAIIVGGDHTFGKGTVQSVENLPPGLGALKTTVGMFFTAGGKSTQHRGVDSDIVFPSSYSTDDIGEKTLDYSLPPKQIKAFLSEDAQAQWKPVDKTLVEYLDKRSQKRIAESEDFKKVLKNIEKIKSRGKVSKVSEILVDRAEAKKEEGVEESDEDVGLTREEKKKKYMSRADINEAVNIVSDMVTFAKKPAIQVGQTPETSPPKN